ncbi:BTAD domain-containing putative transcriptional regulator [Nocardia inohanensis]|uniref:BTAD domain-containing putative transcriptional regulator n=1 Tax=Nocardia inohanensis TaxID=209246 RepID=UPI000833CB0A|nr:BTAD domain-containing putative transcriptional regulator [Nocardia inohanensis]
MTGAELRVLGPLLLSVGGRAVPLGTPMQRAVLGRLIVARGQVVSTERLIDDLWDGQPPAKAASVLQVHIHNLRRLFEPDRPRRAPARYIVSESSGYALKMAERAVDAWAFEEQLRNYQEIIGNHRGIPDPAVRSGLLENVLAQWHGPALEAFADSEWAAPEADRLTELHLTAVELEAQAKLELGRAGEVALTLRPLFEAHPGREEVTRLLAAAQYRLGQQLEALTTIRRAREFLNEEYGIDPGIALRQLEIAILNQAVDPEPWMRGAGIAVAQGHSGATITTPGPPPDASSNGGVPNAMAEPGAVPGYAAELAEILGIAEGVGGGVRPAGGGRLRLAWITGETGIGKTTLAENVAGGLTGAGWTVAAGGCPEIEGAPPAWAWSEILAGLDAWTAEAEAIGTDDPFTLSRTIAERCRRAAASGPVTLLLEDVQRADTATLQVLRQVVSWLRDEPVFVLLTLRRSEAGPGVHTTAAALAPHTATWAELSGLDLAATRSAVAAAGLGPVGEELLAQLHHRAGGNPLFVRELAKLVAAQGNMDQVPDSIREIVNTRIARLPAGVAEVLQHISIWGPGVELGILSLDTGLREAELIDLVAAAEDAGLVGTRRNGSITFEHSLLRDTVYLGIPALRRGRMHWAALELLEANAHAYPALARDPDVLARHAMLGASSETARHAIEYVTAAARRRMRRRMRHETVPLARAAVELHQLAGHDSEHADRADRHALLDARCTLVSALAYDNRHREARAERGRALDLAERLGDPSLSAQALTSWRAPVIWPIREWKRPDNRIRRALSSALARYGLPRSALPTGPDPVDRLPEPPPVAPPGRAERRAGDTLEAIIARDATPGSTRTLIRLLIAATFETGVYEYELRQRLARAALAVARKLGEAEQICAAINAVTYLEFDCGPEFSALADELERLATAAGLAEYRAVAHDLGYRAAAARADLRAAGRQAALAVEFADEGQLQPLLDRVSCFAATTELLRGDIDAAERLYAQYGERISKAQTMNDRESQLFCAIAVGWARGDLAGLAGAIAETYPVLPNAVTQAYALALLHAGEPERARAVFDASDPIGTGLYPILASALRARAALTLGDAATIRELYHYLSPHTGTIVGIETGMAVFGPMDAVLAELADALGDGTAADTHRTRARRLLEHIRAELPPRGAPLPRVA